LYALSKIESKENRIYNISLINKKIKKLFGVKTRLPINSSDEWWNRFTVKMKRSVIQDEVTKSLVFSASTSDAREEEQELFSSISLVDPFIKKISIDNQWNASMAKTLFEIMIPNEFKENLKKKGNICWVLDKDTAAYPWELLKENITEAKPLCIGAGMIRQLTTKEYRQKVTRVAIDRALIVGDPQLDGYVSQLPGAAAEASKVASMFSASGYSNDVLIGGAASDIILKLFSHDFKVIHLAGHGMYNPKALHKSGMVIGKEMFLTVADFKQMGAVPELVFVNCCHLGNVNSDGEIFYRERYKLAANIGTQLIEIGDSRRLGSK
jgi:CHAT domain-containing protein